MDSNPMRQAKQGTYVYCGAVCEVTRDHVIPRCLWPESIPSDIPIVGACQKCDQIGKSGNDAYLRDLLVDDLEVMQNPFVQKNRQKFIWSAFHNRSDMHRDLRDHGKIVETQRPSGLFVPSFVVEVAGSRKANEGYFVSHCSWSAPTLSP